MTVQKKIKFKNYTNFYGKKNEILLKKYCGINLTTYTNNFHTDRISKIPKVRILRVIKKQFKSSQLIHTQIRDSVKFHLEIFSYKGKRHKHNFPVRGQRTHTNRKSAKRLNKYAEDSEDEKEVKND